MSLHYIRSNVSVKTWCYYVIFWADLSFGENICNVAVSKVTPPPTLISHLSKDCHSIATKRRKYSNDDKNFIDSEIKRLLAEKIVKPSNSPW